jgi:hypothetical protein
VTLWPKPAFGQPLVDEEPTRQLLGKARAEGRNCSARTAC